ncbi:MAG: AAA family ATPase [Gammaproteobacteria bacterium]|nr:AAA family ATPase [Gammaproteobacteria bacterium]
MSIIEKVIEKLDQEKPASTDSRKKVIDVKSKRTKPLNQSNNPSESNGQVGPLDDEQENYYELDFQRLNNHGILTPDSINITLSEQFRRIKLPVLANAFGENTLNAEGSNMIMVTSSLQNEGKSFTSFNLAMSIAKEFNHTVLYIDADIRQRMMESFLGIGERSGLVDYLLDDSIALGDLFVKTNVPRLTLLPSGRRYDRVTELWSSQRMNQLMSELSQRYSDRLIIFDAPPLLQDSSASILARLVGQVIIIVEAEKTPRHIVEEAVTMLDDSTYVGLILNKSNQRDVADNVYYYGDA